MNDNSIMTREELLDYITNRTYQCPFCKILQRDVIEKGIVAIGDYSGMVCGSVEDMQIRYRETITGRKLKALDLFEEE